MKLKKINIPDQNQQKNESSRLKRKYCYIFQGGGALGAYQYGAYEAFREHDYPADMVIGISIGGINAAIIAGNKVEDRVGKLRQFWNKITREINIPFEGDFNKLHNKLGAQYALHGVDGFYKPRLVNPDFITKALPEFISYYDTSPLRETLSELIDFKYLNEKRTRLCLGVVELGTGEFVFFDSYKQEICMDHVLATGSLPPAFPPVKINDEYFIDGGVFSNTPLSKILDEFAENPNDLKDILCIMVDLFSAKGKYPYDLDSLLERVKDIQYSSHSKRPNALVTTTQNLSHAIKFLSERLSEDELKKPEVQEVIKLGLIHRIDIVHLVYQSPDSELQSKDYNFSKSAMEFHHNLGYVEAKKLITEQQDKWESNSQSGLTIYTNDNSKISI